MGVSATHCLKSKNGQNCGSKFVFGKTKYTVDGHHINRSYLCNFNHKAIVACWSNKAQKTFFDADGQILLQTIKNKVVN